MKILSREHLIDLDTIKVLYNDFKECISKSNKDKTICPVRRINWMGKDCACFTMEALNETLGIFISKSATFYRRSKSDYLPAINSSVTVFDLKSGKAIAVICGNALTELKCAFTSAYVIEKCTPQYVPHVSIIGSGNQCYSQILAYWLSRNVNSFAVISRTKEKTDKLYDLTKLIDADLSYYNSIQTSLSSNSFISTTTSSSNEIKELNNLKNVFHINAMGATTPESREVPITLLNKSLVIVEDRETAILEAGELHKNAIEITELDDSCSDVNTIFSSTGHAFYDLITCYVILKNEF